MPMAFSGAASHVFPRPFPHILEMKSLILKSSELLDHLDIPSMISLLSAERSRGQRDIVEKTVHCIQDNNTLSDRFH
jgi:hypothetical protein